MQSTDPYFMLFRGLLRTLAMRGVIDAEDATTIIGEALATVSDLPGRQHDADLIESLEDLMVQSMARPSGSSGHGSPADE